MMSTGYCSTPESSGGVDNAPARSMRPCNSERGLAAVASERGSASDASEGGSTFGTSEGSAFGGFNPAKRLASLFGDHSFRMFVPEGTDSVI